MALPAAPAHRPDALAALRLRWKRRRLLWRALRARHQLSAIVNRTRQIRHGDILSVTVLRNEIQRLPYFLSHYRGLGINHFLIVDNGSDDGSAEYLAEQPDVSLWQTKHSYRASRFGLDWLTWLQMRYAHGHWCLMVDADELLLYRDHETCDLHGLTQWLEAQGRPGFGALMLELYPKGPLDLQSYTPGQDPLEVLTHFDAGPYRAVRQVPLGNLWVQGGVRERVFFADLPERSPTLNKLPLMKWNRRWAWVNSCHSILPPKLNHLYDGPGGAQPSGVLIHTKFLPEIVSKSAIEKQRGEHFHSPADFDSYYDGLTAAPDLWQVQSTRYEGLAQLENLGLIRSGDWG